MGDNSFQNNVPDALLSGKPTFKFELEKSKGKVLGNSFGKEATVDLYSWVAGNAVDILATNFSKPESLIRTFPRKDIFIAPGK